MNKLRRSLLIVGVLLLLLSIVLPYLVQGVTKMQISSITASSGSAEDIQAAVDEVVAASGVGDVHIPEGTFNFVEVGEPWMTVNIPIGVNLFGAPTERDADGQVIVWKTVLKMPYEVPTSGPDDRPAWFSIQGNGDPNVVFRFSDVKLVGYREIDSTSITQYTGITIRNFLNFRVDHCNFKNIAGTAVLASASGGGVINGVIDHNRLVNSKGLTGYGGEGYGGRTLGYGIAIYGSDYWIPNLSDVIGKMTDYTVFIEDNYFSKWRHSIASNHGAHYVARYNTIQYCYWTYPFDAHGKDTGVGTRATEYYQNSFIDPVVTGSFEDEKIREPGDYALGCIQVTGGGGVAFNNSANNWYRLIYLSDRAGTDEQTMVNGYYIWDNNLTNVVNEVDAYAVGIPIVLNTHYFLYAKPDYTPYPYPHPLTLGETPTNGGMEGEEGTLEVTATYDGEPIIAEVRVSSIDGTVYGGTTPYEETLYVGEYDVIITSSYGNQTETVTILSKQTTTIAVSWSSTETPEAEIEVTEEVTEEETQESWIIANRIILAVVGAFLVYKGGKGNGEK